MSNRKTIPLIIIPIIAIGLAVSACDDDSQTAPNVKAGDAATCTVLDSGIVSPIALDINPTPFQAIVWEALLSVPRGSVTSYKNIAELINQPKAARAVGTAIARNPIAFLIPCHRVIPLSSKTSAKLGGYRWGVNRKADMIKWEAANHN
ncbi:methylated-DNA--[protein]-cysteine S-methyltransferase [Alphaproteobacteria bacterium]|nr:methylated-DNA--[protein]-cysteine S-methyltransferase [Alphaproteobacteria bacterium]